MHFASSSENKLTLIDRSLGNRIIDETISSLLLASVVGSSQSTFPPTSASEQYVGYRFKIYIFIFTSRKLSPTHTSRFVAELARLIAYEHMAYALWFVLPLHRWM